MNRLNGSMESNGGRIQWGSYGFFAGLAIGILVGWFFAGFIGAFIRVGIVALIVIPIVLLFLAWRRFVTPLISPPRREYVAAPDAIEAQAVVQRDVREPLPR
jgi:predicted lipid-binding transport protein (Tim44 family)